MVCPSSTCYATCLRARRGVSDAVAERKGAHKPRAGGGGGGGCGWYTGSGVDALCSPPSKRQHQRFLLTRKCKGHRSSCFLGADAILTDAGMCLWTHRGCVCVVLRVCVCACVWTCLPHLHCRLVGCEVACCVRSRQENDFEVQIDLGAKKLTLRAETQDEVRMGARTSMRHAFCGMWSPSCLFLCSSTYGSSDCINALTVF